MLIWRGHGILIPVAAVVGLIGGWIVLGVLVALLKIEIPSLPVILGFWTSALCVWLYALTLGKPVDQVMVNPHTGQQFVRRYSPHTFFFMPAKVWGIFGVLLAIAVSCWLPFVKLPSGKALAKPGKAEFDSANSLVTSDHNGAAHGNTAAAKALAEKFSTRIKEYRDAGIEKATKKSSLSLSHGQFLTYCHLREEDCVFLVHVPDLRKFSEEAKEFICTAAWHTANSVLADQPKLPKRLAVGVRGALLYEEFITGSAVGASDDPENGIEQRHGGLDKEVLFPFFAPQKAVKDAGAVAKEEDKPAPAASKKPAESPKAEPQAPPTAPASTAAAPADPEPAPPMASPPPAPQPAPASPPAPATAALPTEVREWKSADGRPMKAALISFTDATGTTAKFRREDGQEFDVPVEKFSPQDQAELKRLHQAGGGS